MFNNETYCVYAPDLISANPKKKQKRVCLIDRRPDRTWSQNGNYNATVCYIQIFVIMQNHIKEIFDDGWEFLIQVYQY